MSLSVTPSPRAFAGSPIIATLSGIGSAFPAGSKMRMVNIVVSSSGRTLEFQGEYADGDFVCDISSAARAFLFGLNYTPIVNGNDDMSGFKTDMSVQYYLSYMLDGKFIKGGKLPASGYPSITVYPGSFSEIERLSGNTISGPFVLSRKPAGEIVGVGHQSLLTLLDDNLDHLILRITHNQVGSSAVAVDPDVLEDEPVDSSELSSYSRSVYVEHGPRRHRFLFVNSYGALEDASALALEAKQVALSKTTYRRHEAPSYVPTSGMMARSTSASMRYTMSSGAVTTEWAQWWATEFLGSEQHWMLIGDKWIPVVVSSKSDSTSIVNLSSTTPSSIDFEVQVALKGVL